ncbi:uncharacterized protein FYW61_006608 [Anableps anableps]
MEKNGDEVCYSTVNIKNAKAPPKGQPKEETATLGHSRLLLVCLGILCVLLVVSITVIINMSIVETKHQARISDLTTENGRLTEDRDRMQNQTKELSQERDNLNRTLEFILTFDNFPVKDFCPDKKCQPCQKGWIIFKKKCYLFYEEPRPWKTWEESRKFCQDKHADLVVIDDLQEQEFVSNHTKYYFDNYHGYWLGLQETNNRWIWVDGHEDTLGFWVKEELGETGSYTLLIPGRNPTESWDKADELFKNKFICGHEALTVPFSLSLSHGGGMTSDLNSGQPKEETATLGHSRLLLVCLGILCVLLVVSITVIINMSIVETKHQARISDLTTENGRLTEDRDRMQNQTKELSQERDNLNRTLEFILTFDNFPVKDFCPDKKCQPCQKGWIIFKKKCYLFYEEPRPWKTWEESRKFCQDKHADLVVIDDLQEQEFVSNHTKYYFDNYHGYWLGLQETNNRWIWVDGHEDTLGFWVKEELGETGSYTLLIPGRNPTESWDKADELFKNKFICGHEALTVPFSLSLSHGGGMTSDLNSGQPKEETATLGHSRLLLVCLGILCVLLVVSITVIINMSIVETKHQARISDLTTENGRLTEDRDRMQNQTKELSQERDNLNRTLEFILTFDNFPVKDFCPDKKCQPCQKGWIIFKKKCYLFYEEPRPWKTWEESRKFCQDKHADLVVIDDLQEQEFVSNHTKYYFDNYHGYWLGLQETNNRWIWVDGHEDTLGFWVKEELGETGSYTLLIPGRNPTESWDKADELFQNKFICGHEALTV